MTINFASVTYNTMIDNFSKTLTHTTVTKTVSNSSGDETLTDGTPVSISGAFFRKEDSWSQENPGLLQNADAVLLLKVGTRVSKNDKISYDFGEGTETYRVQKTVDRKLGTTFFYQASQLFKI